MKVNQQKVFADIRERGYSIFPGFLSAEILINVREEYFRCLKNLPIHSQGERFSPRSLTLSPWRKYAIGSKSGSGEPYSQILQTTYFSPSDSNYPELSSVFNQLVVIRNSLTNMRADYGADLDNDDFWNACRVHHYPQGGGHMASHRDTLFPKLLAGFEFPFIQLMVTLSARGFDFHQGGGYVIDRSGARTFFETETNAGSLVLFDGNTTHGVDDVDSGELFDVSSRKGRIAIFVNLYSNFVKND